MNTIWAVVLLAGGLLVLWKSADLLVGGAVRLAERLGVSALVVGLTVVAMGTSAPEVAASIAAAIRGDGDIAIGNVYGSNIANLALVGGLACLIRPLTVRMQTLRREIPVMLFVALLLWPVLHNLKLGWLEGCILLAVFATLILLTIYTAQKEAADSSRIPSTALGAGASEAARDIRNRKKNVLSIAIGLVGLAVGAELTVRGAKVIGEHIGLSSAVVGQTLVAVGTSLPELATCLVAAIKGHHDISIGNLVGSNIFNTLLVTGVAGTVRPFEIGARLVGADYWIMIGVSVAFALIAIVGRRTIGRAGATLLLCGYIGYLVYLLGYSG